MDLEDVVRAAKRGEPLALAALLRALGPYVGRICAAIALDDGDDAMQETMIRVLKGIHRLREPAALHGWVRRIAVREALRLARTRRTLVPVEQVPEPPNGMAPELRVEVADTLRQLTPEQRAILVLRELEGFAEAEAAALLDVPVGTAKSRLHRLARPSGGGGRDEPVAHRPAQPGASASGPRRGAPRRRSGGARPRRPL